MRGLLESKNLSLLVVLTLALAIGAATAIASVVQGVLLRPLDFPDQERLYMLWQRAPGVSVDEDWFSIAQYFDLKEQVPAFESLALVFGANVTLTGEGLEPERVGALRVSSSFFDMLAIEPELGRALLSADDLPGASEKALLGKRLFEGRYRGDPGVVGRTVELDGRRIEVVGVLPSLTLDAETFPTLATIPRFELVLSLPVEDPQRTTNGSENYNILGKLAPGVSRERLETELLAVSAAFVKEEESLGSGLEPGTEYLVDAVPLLEEIVGHVRLTLWVLLGATGGLLLVACANVINLLLARAARQRREIALRTALGAGPARLALRSLLSSATLGLLGAAGGLGIAWAAIRMLRATAPAELPRMAEIGVDLRMLLFAALLGLVSAALFGAGPALRHASAAPRDALGESSASVRARSPWRGGTFALVAFQVALSLALVIGAGLLARTFWSLLATDPGFRPERVLTFRISLVGERYQEREDRARFFELLFDRLRELPGVHSAGGTSMLPLTRGYAWTDFHLAGTGGIDPRDRVVADVRSVTPGYFEAMGIPLLAGRSFTRADAGEPPTVLVNAAFAEYLGTPEESLSRLVGRDPGEWETIVGVAGDVKHYGLDQETRLTVFYPYRASARRTLYGVVRTHDDAPEALAADVTGVVHDLDANLPVYDVRPMAERVGASLARRKLVMRLFYAFAAVALTLAAVGLYGLLAYTVSSQARELGVRKALGARGPDLLGLVLSGAARVTAIGVLSGLLFSLGASRYLSGMVHGVSALDPATVAVASVFVALVVFGASLLPARRAAAVDPMSVLKDE